jgi:hypothetical protein
MHSIIKITKHFPINEDLEFTSVLLGFVLLNRNKASNYPFGVVNIFFHIIGLYILDQIHKKHLIHNSELWISRVRVAQSLVFCVVLASLFVFMPFFFWPWYCLSFTVSDNPFGIFKMFFCLGLRGRDNNYNS